MPKLRSLESILQPINRLPKEVFILIPCFFPRGWDNSWGYFPMNKPLITMTHVCRSWRNLLLSTPSLWTQIDFSMSTESQQADFLRRSGNQPLDIYQLLENQDHVEPFLSITLHNLFRLRELSITSFLPHLERLLRNFSSSAPELKYLEIENERDMTQMDIKLPKIFGGRMPKLTSLSLCSIRTNLRDLNFPTLTRFSFETGTNISVRDLTSFFERSPSLEFIQISLSYRSQPPTPPPRRRLCLAALRELRLDQIACTTGLLDHLILPKCTEVMLRGQFTGEIFDAFGDPAAQIHPSSIDHLPVTRGITKAVAIPRSCSFSGPNGNLTFGYTREYFDADYFASFSPISVLQIRGLWVGQRTESWYNSKPRPWKQTAGGVHSAFEVLTKVEDLTIVSCETEPFFATLGATVDGGVLLPGLQRLTVYVGCGDLNVSALTRCVETRGEHSHPLGEVTVVWEEDPGVDVMQEVESLGVFVGKLIHRVGETPQLGWRDKECGRW